MSDQPSAQPVRRRWWGPAVLLGLVLPLLATSVLLWATTGRQSALDRIPVAIVNNDTIITGSQPMAAGRSLTAALLHPKDPQDNLGWTLTDQKDATAGLRDGTYYAVLTVPSNFSSAILSTGTDKPRQGQLQLVSNGAASSTVPYISQQIAAATSAAFGNQVTQGYLGNVYDGFNSLASGNSKSASSASQLAGGTAQLSSGAASLDQGASSLASSLGSLSSGADGLASSTRSLDSGAAGVADGASGVSSGADRLHHSAQRLAGASGQVARKSAGLAGGARRVAEGARSVSRGVGVLAARDRAMADVLDRLYQRCQASASRRSCRPLDRARQRADRIAGFAAQVHTGAERTATGAGRVGSGAGSLAKADAALARNNRELADGLGRLGASAGQLSSGADSLAAGAGRLVTGADQVAQGSRSAASAGGSLAAGSRSLASSAGKTDQGAQQLSSGLAKAAKQSPTYSSSQKKALTPVVSQPVNLTSQVQHTQHGNGWLIALVVAVILWLAVLVSALSLDLSGLARNVFAPVSSRPITAAHVLPLMGFAVLQGAAVLAALLLLRTSAAQMGPLVVLTLLAALSFSLVALALRVALGRVGIAIFVLLLLLQLAASGNVIPLQTAPAMLRGLNGVLPLSAFINGASQLVSGGHAASLLGVGIVLVAWGVLAVLVMLSSVKRRRLGRSPSPGRPVPVG